MSEFSGLRKYQNNSACTESVKSLSTFGVTLLNAEENTPYNPVCTNCQESSNCWTLQDEESNFPSGCIEWALLYTDTTRYINCLPVVPLSSHTTVLGVLQSWKEPTVKANGQQGTRCVVTVKAISVCSSISISIKWWWTITFLGGLHTKQELPYSAVCVCKLRPTFHAFSKAQMQASALLGSWTSKQELLLGTNRPLPNHQIHFPLFPEWLAGVRLLLGDQ